MDNILTTQIQQFLQLEKPTEEQIREGATLLLRCNPQRERAIYNSAMTRPKSMLPWIKADLKKYLGIRQRGLTTPQVEKFNQETIAAVKQTLSKVPVTVEQDSGETPLIPQLGIRGLRPDHDQLPEDIQALFTKNTERWKSMRKLHAQLAQMIARPGYAAVTAMKYAISSGSWTQRSVMTTKPMTVSSTVTTNLLPPQIASTCSRTM